MLLEELVRALARELVALGVVAATLVADEAVPRGIDVDRHVGMVQLRAIVRSSVIERTAKARSPTVPWPGTTAPVTSSTIRSTVAGQSSG